MKRIFLIFFLIADLLSYCQNFPYQVQNYSDADGLSSNSIKSIQQDNKGFLWIGTEDGLCRFDGLKFKIYRHSETDTNTISGNYIYQIIFDGKGNLWVLSNGKSLDRMDLSTGKIHHYYGLSNDLSFSINSITCLFIDSQKEFWLGDSSGTIIRAGYNETAGFYKLHKTFNSSEYSWKKTISFFTEDGQGRIFYVDESSKLYVINKLDSIKYKKEHFFFDSLNKKGNDSSITSIAIIENDKYFFSTWDEIIYYNSRTGINKTWKCKFGISISSPVVNNSYIYFTGPNVIYSINTINLVFNTIHTTTVPTEESNINADKVLYCDRQGILWSGNSAGLTKLYRKSKQFESRQINSGPNVKTKYSIRSISGNGSSTLWFGTDTHGFFKYDLNSRKYTHVKLTGERIGSKKPIPVWALNVAYDDILWASHYYFGMLCYNSKNNERKLLQRSETNKNTISGNYIKSIVHGDYNEIWVSGGWALSRIEKIDSKSNGYHIERWDTINQIAKSEVRCIYPDGNTIWFGTSGGGFFCFKYKGQGKPPEISTNLLSVIGTHRMGARWINSICKSSDGQIWIGTYGAGLIKYNPQTKKYQNYTEENGLSNNNVYGILVDANHNLWLSTNKGLNKFNPATGKFMVYDVLDGLQGNEFNSGAYYKDKSGRMYFGGTNGWTTFHPDSIVLNDFESEILITDFQIFDSTINVAEGSILPSDINYIDKIILSSEQSVFSFELSATNFIDAQKNQFMYKLEGYDTDWRKNNTKNYISYSKIDPGNYILKIIASNNDNVWSKKIKMLNITILPPYHKTWWFRLLIFISGLILLSVIIYPVYRLKMIRFEEHEKFKQILHNRVQNQLVAIKNRAWFISTKTVDQQNELMVASKSIEKNTKNALENIRELLSGDYKKNSLVTEMLDSIEEFVNSVYGGSTVEIEFRKTEMNKEDIIPYRIGSLYYELFTETINNCFKHSYCSKLLIKYGMINNKLFFEVEDDGVGFDFGSVSKRGLEYSLIRAKKISGRYQVKSVPGKGTHVIFSVKLPKLVVFVDWFNRKFKKINVS